MKYNGNDHTFAVCAYKESPYLEDCVLSLTRQQTLGRIILSTATPNDYIDGIATKYGLKVFVNEGPHGLGEDWNFAYAHAETPLVTLAHQDDVYEPDYLEKVLARINAAKSPMICFTDYYELRDNRKVYSNSSRLLKIKEIALSPLRLGVFENSRWMHRRILSLCNPICCPSVTFVREHLPKVVFETQYLSNIDWLAWEQLSRVRGGFCYVPQPLMGHRIHRQSTTSELIGDSKGRSDEDLEMYLKFWPKPIARLLNRFYSGAQEQNEL